MHPQKDSLYFSKWNFLAVVLENFLYFLIFLETETQKKILILQKTEAIKELLVFLEMELFSPSSKNKIKNPPRKISYIFSKESCSYISGNENPEKIFFISGNRNPKRRFIFQEVTFRAQKVKIIHF